MFKSLIKNIWGKMPYRWRVRAIRSTQTKFTSSVVGIITDSEGRILLLDHFLRPGTSWALPGGFMESGEQPENALRREIKEETTLEITNVKLITVRTINRHLEILFRAEAAGEPRPNSHEIVAAGWFFVGEMPKEVSQVQKRLIEQVLNPK